MGLLELLGLKPKVNFKEIYDNGAIIIDVRTQGEYKQGNYKGSQNIPLDQISKKIKDIKSKNKVVIAVCKSGMRSGQATSILKQNGIEAHNAGPWTSLSSKLK
jgi:rhodanese-related sulfurtransferase